MKKNVKKIFFSDFFIIFLFFLISFLLAFILTLFEKEKVIVFEEKLVFKELYLNFLEFEDEVVKIESKLLEPNLILVKGIAVKPPKFNSRSKEYETYINNASLKYNVSPVIIKAIIQVESNYNNDASSQFGAIGLMQIMPNTAIAMGASNPHMPEENINAGVKYFKKLLIEFNDNEMLALAAYNCGPNKVKKYGNKIPPIKETEDFVNKVMYLYKFNLVF